MCPYSKSVSLLIKIFFDTLQDTANIQTPSMELKIYVPAPFPKSSTITIKIPETILSHTFFMRNPEEFYRFYHDKMLALDAKPNAAHRKLAELEQAGKLRAVVTQNIDGLHQAAGSRNVLELHGSVHRNYCMKCHEFYDAEYMAAAEGVPRCEKCGGIIKPDVVLYEEGLDQKTLEAAVSAISRAQVLIVGGTSLVVYPAAGLLRYFGGDRIVLINKGATSMDSQADLLIQEPIGQVLDQIAVR